MNRRGFLATLAASGSLLIGGRALSAFAAPSADHSLVWRLDSHWGYPTGPSQRSHCQCNACVKHAQNKVFASQADAVAGRAHTHCVCEPRAVQIDATKFTTLFSGGATSADLRSPGVSAAYQAALASAHAG